MSDGPRFSTVIVNVVSVPAVAVASALLVTWRSALVFTVVLTVLLVRGLPASVAELADAWLVMIVPLAVEGLTVARMVIDTEPLAAIVPTFVEPVHEVDGVQLTPVQNWAPVSAPLSVSETVTDWASDGPALLTTMV